MEGKEKEREREEEGGEMNNLLIFIVALPKELFYKFIGNNWEAVLVTA